MPSEMERIASLEARQQNLKDDLQMLFKFHREHMVKEEARWVEIHSHMVKQKTFVGTVIFLVSALWAVGIAVWTAGFALLNAVKPG